MNKTVCDMLKVKKNGKYVKTAKEVAGYHGVHVNAVYQSRKSKKNPDRLDKLMLFDEASNIANYGSDDGLTMRGSKEGLLDFMAKAMEDGKNYLIVFTEEESGDE